MAGGSSVIPRQILSCSCGENLIFLHGCGIKYGQRPGNEAKGEVPEPE